LAEGALLSPAAAAITVEIGCGRLGGFVPKLRTDGYVALGIDPVAPEGNDYRGSEFEDTDPIPGLQAVIACTSLLHVTDPAEVLDKVATALGPGGVVIVVEWDWEGFDEATARWCFERLASEPESWLHHRRDERRDSRQAWEHHLRGWAGDHGLHGAQQLLAELDRRFERVLCSRGPYFFPELYDTSEADEIEAINPRRIRAVRVDYVGRLP
jgi:SAM-dependent methyltransferase